MKSLKNKKRIDFINVERLSVYIFLGAGETLSNKKV